MLKKAEIEALIEDFHQKLSKKFLPSLKKPILA